MSCTRILLQLAPAVLAIFAVAAPPAAAQDAPWTSAASAGTVDESDLLLVQLGTPVAGAVSMRPVPRGLVRVRYNVVAVADLAAAPDVSLTARFLDQGELQRVVLRLKEYDLRTGETKTLVTLDSDSYTPSSGFQTQTVTTDCGVDGSVLLDFANHAYFVDAELTKVPFVITRPPGPPTAIGRALPLPVPSPEPDDAIGPALGIVKVGRSTRCTIF